MFIFLSLEKNTSKCPNSHFKRPMLRGRMPGALVAQAAITIYHRPGGLNDRNLFHTVMEARSL